jgi:tetratricopeptide (TPR) repeat protein
MKQQQPFTIKYPLLWLAAAVVAVYARTVSFGFTQLDDSIFIQDMRAFNEDVSNLINSFRQGVFHATDDTYYRPFFLNSIILNYQVSGEDIAGYHVVNIALHLLCVGFFYRLLKQIGVYQLHAFLLALLFAVHPVLSQAVTWIPGRNDTLLAAFLLPYLSCSIAYVREGKTASLVGAALLLACGLFTKETALLAPGAAFVLLVIALGYSWKSRRMLVQYGVWVLVFLGYLGMKSMATLGGAPIEPLQLLSDFLSRLPLIVQYSGKIFFPFNLSVFPMQQDTVYYYGIAALALLAVLIVMTKEKQLRLIIGGALLFLLFLLPALLIPNNLNDQAFEHRLYLPITGMLLLLSQTVAFRNRLPERKLVMAVGAVAVVFAGLNYRHQEHFKDPVVFWKQAAETSPHSSYALMMYGARVDGRPNKYRLIREAYAINPKEKYLNYYYGLMMYEQDSFDKAIAHFLDEQQRSDYYECDFHLARIYFLKEDFPKAAGHLERYLTRDSLNDAANSNLLLLYIDMNQKDQALMQVERMYRRGIPVSPPVMQRLNALP